MKQAILLLLVIISINQCSSQKGFPKQFQTTFNMTDQASGSLLIQGLQNLLYDFNNLRARFDIQSWQTKQNETYMLQYKPKGAEADSPASQGFTLFNYNPDYPPVTKNKCWYRTDPMSDIGPFPASWFYNSQDKTDMLPWFPLPSNLINKGEEWIPEIQMNATRYDSPEICNLVRSGIGRVPCLSYFETSDRPVKTITAYAAKSSFDTDSYIVTVYLSFTHGIPSEAEKLFNLPNQWPSYCGNANNGFLIDPVRGYVITPKGNDRFYLNLTAPPVHALGDQIIVQFEIKSNWYYNGTQCAKFNPIIFDKTNWQKPQQVEMSFIDYGCCNYRITANGGGYDWQYNAHDFVVYACDGEAGYGCKGKEPCGA